MILILYLPNALSTFYYDSVHDRKVYVFGICSMLSIPAETRPEAVKLFAPQLLPALLVVFKGLVASYESKFVMSCS